MMRLGPKGEALIKSFEQLALIAYQDQGGIWSIGWGHTPASKGQTCTSEEAQTWFLTDVEAACRAVEAEAIAEDARRRIDLGAVAGAVLLDMSLVVPGGGRRRHDRQRHLRGRDIAEIAETDQEVAVAGDEARAQARQARGAAVY